jgi:acetyltransferase-like isoleucine patch superfamily enzyme
VLQNIRIGENAVIGGGAVVIRDVEALTTVVGVPARPVHGSRRNDDFVELLTPPSLRRPHAGISGR